MNKEIYEIFRACRLCGVGAGYKMPIIQGVIDVDDEETELKQKIKECVQIEVNLHDRMPPLICELCVDKIHDFYEFRKMCQETNRRTRLRLGLPVQTSRRLEPDSILGMTEPLNTDSEDGEPLSKQHIQKKPRPKSVKIKKENDVQIKIEPPTEERSRSSSVEVVERRETRNRRAQSPKRVTRRHRGSEIPFGSFQIDENGLLIPRQKRYREVPLETSLPFKKAKLTMEPPQPERISKPGPKSSKETPKLTPPQKPPPKIGPKSKKLDTTPAKSQTLDTTAPTSKKPGTVESTHKSKKIEPQVIPVSKSKSEVAKPKPDLAKTKLDVAKSKSEVAKPGPKSRKRQPSPVAVPKSKKVENLPVSTPNRKKREEQSPAPKLKKTGDPSPKEECASHNQCKICGIKCKTSQGLMSHTKTHDVKYTPPELACNACEMWFPDSNAASEHRNLHTSMTLAYTCSKCYDDFQTDDDYEMHFTRNQCLPTYEVPDVKCDECWKTFPTYKLMEDHKCQGEGSRPGGKCPNCRRVYLYLRSLRAHELRCTGKRKVEPQTEATPEVPRGMLPMQVRIVRCDTLLPISRDGHYDVRGLSHKFGLDRCSTYPYFYSMAAKVKSEPSTFDPMVAIDDNIKLEYIKNTNTDDSFIHWDTDDSNDSEDDTSNSTKSVRSLSNISLKTLFSSKCLGKVPKKQRKVKTELSYDSVLSIGFNIDLKKNIHSIIDNLGNESIHSGDYDSDSILDKNAEKKECGADIFDSLKENVTSNVQNHPADENTKQTDKPGEESNTTNRLIDRLSNTEDLEENENLRMEDNTQNENDQNTNDNREKQYKEIVEQPKKVTDDTTRIEECINAELHEKIIVDSGSKENFESSKITEDFQNNSECKNSPKNGHLVTNNIVSDDKSLSAENKVENTTPLMELENTDVEMSEEKRDHENNELDGTDTDSQLSEINEPKEDSNTKHTESHISSEKDDKINENGDICDVKNDGKDDKIHENGDLCNVKNDTENDNTNINQNYELSCVKDRRENESPHIRNELPNDNCEWPNSSNDKVNEHDDSSNVISKNLNENIDSHAQTDTNHTHCTKTYTETDSVDADFSSSKDEETSKDNDKNTSHNSGESLITENDLFGSKNIQSVDKFNINNLDDEDKLLMAELDAQIGESTEENDVISESEFPSNANDERKNIFGENSGVISENIKMMSENTPITDLQAENDNIVEDINSSNAAMTKDFTDDKIDSLDVLINKQDDLKSLDLDNISDEEFNFDI